MKEEIGQSDTLSRLDQMYQENVKPYETIVKTISMHNSQIYSLQQKYKNLQQQYNLLKGEVQLTKKFEEKSRQRKVQLKKETNKFLEESLYAREKEFNDQYKSKRMQRLEEIGLKYQQISMIREDRSNYNIFFNLEEGLLEQVIHSLQGPNQEEMKKELASWLNIYRTAMQNQLK